MPLGTRRKRVNARINKGHVLKCASHAGKQELACLGEAKAQNGYAPGPGCEARQKLLGCLGKAKTDILFASVASGPPTAGLPLLYEVKAQNGHDPGRASNASNASNAVITIYRPPPSKKNGLTPSMFFKEFSLLVERLAATSNRCLITGDLNLPIATMDKNATQFLDLIVFRTCINM